MSEEYRWLSSGEVENPPRGMDFSEYWAFLPRGCRRIDGYNHVRLMKMHKGGQWVIRFGAWPAEPGAQEIQLPPDLSLEEVQAAAAVAWRMK